MQSPGVVFRDWIPQFVGLSGDHNPYLLRHCMFDNDRYKKPEWECWRVTRGGDAHFVVCAPLQAFYKPH